MAVGDTERVPVTGTAPMPWFILALAASVVLHLIVVLSPDSMLESSAVNEFIVGRLQSTTIIVRLRVTVVPPDPTAVRV